MPKRSSSDINQLAARIVADSTSDKSQSQNPPNSSDVQTSGLFVQTPGRPAKNPAAVALGRLGGLKGGKARARSLSKARRSEIAAKAAKSRWGKKK